MNKEDILKVLKELRQEQDSKRNFEQGIDLIINLKKFDVRKASINIFVNAPNRIKEKKICAFLNKKNEIVDTIIKDEFEIYRDKKQLKKLAKKYDFFIASANLMPSIATVFGRVFGPLGKMPSPQLGVVTSEDEKTIKTVIEKINSVIRIKTKEPSIKVSVGKENMKDEEIVENILIVYNAVVNALPNQKEQIRNVMIKFTMGKPRKIEEKKEKQEKIIGKK